jgi:hypothetical protein
MSQIGRLNVVAQVDVGGLNTGDVETPNTGEVQLFVQVLTMKGNKVLSIKNSDGTVQTYGLGIIFE